MKSRRLAVIAAISASMVGKVNWLTEARYAQLKRKLGSGELKAKRSPELVAEFKGNADAKRARKAALLRGDALMRDLGYYRTEFGCSDKHCFHSAAKN